MENTNGNWKIHRGKVENTKRESGKSKMSMWKMQNLKFWKLAPTQQKVSDTFCPAAERLNCALETCISSSILYFGLLCNFSFGILFSTMEHSLILWNTHLHSSYWSQPPKPAVVYFFWAGVLFNIENAEFWPILVHFDQFGLSRLEFTYFLLYFLLVKIIRRCTKMEKYEVRPFTVWSNRLGKK